MPLHLVILSICISFLTQQSCAQQYVSPAEPAKRFVLDLDLPPEKRWGNILRSFDRDNLVSIYQHIINDLFKDDKIKNIVQILADGIEEFLPSPYAQEIRGISEVLSIDVAKLVQINLAYDVTAYGSSDSKACTSIVATDKRGMILHGRNLDYGEYGVRNITIDVDFQRRGKTVYTATTFLGFVGILTATKTGRFSLTADERDQGGLWKNIEFALMGSWPTLLLARQVVEVAEDYESAITLLMKSDTMAPIYFIVGGINPHEGAIVVRDRSGGVNVTRMGTSDKSWFIVETNYDPWKRPPSTDDRRDAAIRSMLQVGKMNIDAEQLYKVLSKRPVFNVDTVHTTIMSAADNSVYRTMIRFDSEKII